MSAVEALRTVLESKPGAEAREGQQAMAKAVERAIEDRSHLLVEAGTGTGKSLAYLVPALTSGAKTVVSTATKNLQNQLSDADLPFLAETLPEPFSWAVLKGRQSYLCMAKLGERFGPDLKGEGLLFPDDDVDAMITIADWALDHPTGDRDDLEETVEDPVWRAVSVSGMECPGKNRCDYGDVCFAEAAFERAHSADVVVTNHHLYGLHLTSGGHILPDHDVVVFDEAHRLESSFSSSFGVDLGAGRLHAFANNAARLIDPTKKAQDPIGVVRDAASGLDRVVTGLDGSRLTPGDGALGTALRDAQKAVAAALKCLVAVEEGTPDFGPVSRVKNQGGHLMGDIEMAFDLPEDYVAWSEPYRGVVRVAPIEVGGSLAGTLLTSKPAVMTSATLTVGGSFVPLARRLGFLEEPIVGDPFADDVEDPIPRTYRGLAVEGSFDYMRQGLLYIAAHLPDPRDDQFPDDAAYEMEKLVDTAGGRSLVLTTSYRNMERFAEHLGGDRPYRVLVQGELPKRQLIAEFQQDETSCLVATMGYWEGIDVPGRSLSMVVIDKLPFSRPDDPLVGARRELVEQRGGSAFDQVDIPHVAMLLAQGAGRLIRNESDRGVVALLDRRLVSKRYGMRIIRTLPKFARTTDRRRALEMLDQIAADTPR